MILIPENPIDYIYLEKLERISKWYDEDLDFALKQCIAIHHKEITDSEKE